MAQSEAIRKVPEVGRIQEVRLELCDPVADSRYHVQYAHASGQQFEITVPIREAFRLMDVLKKSKPDDFDESVGETSEDLDA